MSWKAALPALMLLLAGCTAGSGPADVPARVVDGAPLTGIMTPGSYNFTARGAAGEWVGVHLAFGEPVEELGFSRTFEYATQGEAAGAALFMLPGPVFRYEGERFLPSRDITTAPFGAGDPEAGSFADSPTLVGAGEFTGMSWFFGSTAAWNVTVHIELEEDAIFSAERLLRGSNLTVTEVPIARNAVGGTFSLQHGHAPGWVHVEFVREPGQLGGTAMARAMRYEIAFAGGFAWPPAPYDVAGVGFGYGYDAGPLGNRHSQTLTNRVIGSFAEPAGEVSVEGTFADTEQMRGVYVATIPIDWASADLEALRLEYAQF